LTPEILERLNDISELITSPLNRYFIELNRKNEKRINRKETRYLVFLSEIFLKKEYRTCLKIMSEIAKKAIEFKRKSPREGSTKELAKMLGKKSLVA
jgi:hypothetical protein